jgi:DNA-binding response OmpR family regulator
VLIVEDEVLQSDLLANALLDAGAIEVRRCETAGEALAQFRDFIPTILILDIRLADRNEGWLIAELAQQILPRMPLIVFATGSPERIPAHIAALGVVAAKPYDVAELIERLRQRVQSPARPGWRALLRRRPPA